MISFIIPAHNEESVIAQTLGALRTSAAQSLQGREFEVVVVNDSSTDRTGEIARQFGATVVNVQLRHIAAVRNAGAKVARGDVFCFVDADTIVPAAVLRAVMRALDRGAVGGGSNVVFDGDVPFLSRVMIGAFMIVWRPLNLAAGCFVFARRSDFQAVGGFDERFFASEEVWMSKALKGRGRFVVVRQAVITSARKLRMHTPWQMFRTLVVLGWKGPAGLQQRQGLDIWYDGRREIT